MVDVSKKNFNTVKEILAKYIPGLEVRVFGSRVNGRAKPYSDLDIAIIGTKELNSMVLIQLKEAFQESDLPFRVDILDWNKLSPEFRDIIARNHVVIHIQGV